MQAVQVAGVSMSPTLADSNWYLLNRLVYRFREPRPGDIVVLSDPQVPGFAIKRIVARPGDAVYIKGGQVYVNGELLDEPYLKPDTQTYSGPDYVAQFWVCGAGHYFVLGDNRNNSTDSRIYGTVPQQHILGMVMH
jgi:signal peptidase I